MNGGSNLIIALEGIIGVGKSHFIKTIRKNFSNVKIFTEGIDKKKYKKLVKDYYTDPFTYAYPFQLTMLWRKAKDGLKAQKYDKDTYEDGIALIERTISSNNKVFCRMAFEKGYVNRDYYELYNDSYDDLKQLLKRPDMVLYLHCPVEFAFNNIAERKRGGEELITLDYLVRLQELYGEWLENYKGKVEDIYFNNFMSEDDICDIFQNVLEEVRG